MNFKYKYFLWEYYKDNYMHGIYISKIKTMTRSNNPFTHWYWNNPDLQKEKMF